MDKLNSTATARNMEPLKMPRRDYFKLPAHFRNVADGLKVLASVGSGRQAFVPVTLI